MDTWTEHRLKDLVNINSLSVDRNYPFTEIEYLDTGSITSNRISGFQRLAFNDAPSRAKRLVKHFDTIYSLVRPNQRHYGFIRNPLPNLVVSTGFAVISPKIGITDPKFLYYFLSSDDVVSYLDLIAEGSTSAYPSIRPEDIQNLEILLPSLPEQTAIASVLSSLDDKIDLLHRQNKTLEQLAETIFRQWFVEEVRSEWQRGILNDIITVKGGSTPSTKVPEYWDGDIFWATPKDLSNLQHVYIFNTERKITKSGLNQISSGLLSTGTVLLSSRAPIGYIAISEIPLAINQGFIAIICDKVVSNYFIYLWCKWHIEEIKNSGNGSVFQEISKSVFKTLAVIIPPSELLDEFEITIDPIFRKIKSNQEQIRTLTQLRDNLLPKLMSGEVRVKY